MKENSMEKKNFIDFIKLELNKPMPLQEAVQKIADFHQTSTENVLNAFINLKRSEEGDTALFLETVNSSSPCIAIEVRNQKGDYKSSSKINQYTGQPMVTVG
ncbi:MAG: hypothetical protein WC662_01740 [Candidatus Paceibacterota bacterium]|jgi:hypothetical protein